MEQTKLSKKERIRKDFRVHWFAYLLIVPVLVWYLIFCYAPMWGVMISFQDFKPLLGFFKSPWVGWKHYTEFLTGPYCLRLIKNTLMMNVWGLLFGFPAPIILAVVLNEIRHKWLKRSLQTITYMPHFISLVVLCGMIYIFTQPNGILTTLVGVFTGNSDQSLLGISSYFRPIYTFSGVWQNIGWDSIIYLSAIGNIDSELYESASLDGANRLQSIWHVTLPGMLPTIIILLIYAMGGLLNSSFEKVILLYNPLTYDRADVIASYVYRRGIREASYSFSTAVGLMSSVINFGLLWATNVFARKYSDISLW